jgi:hypothetical protein
MTDSEMIKFMRKEIQRQVNVILSGRTGSNTVETEDIEEMLPGMPTQPLRPVSHPYGFASRAQRGTLQVTARMGDHTVNRMVISHRDVDRPTDLEEGESVVYSKEHYQLRIENGQIQVGKDGEFEPVIMGETMRQLMISLIDLIISHRHLGNLGFDTSPPRNAADFLQLRELDSSNILAKDGVNF